MTSVTDDGATARQRHAQLGHLALEHEPQRPTDAHIVAKRSPQRAHDLTCGHANATVRSAARSTRA